MKKLSHVLSAIFITAVSTFCEAKSVVVYPQPGEIYTKHHRYPVELLELALSYQTESYSVAPSKNFMTQGRAVKQLQQGKDIDVLWTMTSREREKEALAIRIPIYKGLIGWRLFLTTPTHLASRQKTWTFKDIQQSTMIQGHDWPDNDILNHNNFKVLKVPNYEGMFQILSLNRAELFPRSVVEIWDELETHKNSNIVIDPKLLISYPTATYFFVSPNNKALAQVIESGLQKSLNDGQFDALFDTYYADIIQKANLDNRLHFRLSNPLLPDATPLKNKSLWFSLDKD